MAKRVPLRQFVELQRLSGTDVEIPYRSPVVVTLNAVEVYDVSGRDILHNWDIQMRSAIAGQTKTFAWKAKLVPEWTDPLKRKLVEDKMKRILYIGRPEGLLDVEFEVVESDRDEREDLRRVGVLLDAIKSALALVPLYGPPAGAALDLGASVTSLIGHLVDDDSQLKFHGSVWCKGMGNRAGTYQVNRHWQKGQFGGEKGDLKITFTVEPFKPKPLSVPVQVALKSVELDLKTCSDSDLVTLALSVTGPAGEKDPKPTPRSVPFAFSDTWKNSTNLSAGRPLGWRMGIDYQLLYEGPVGKGLKFAVSIAALEKSVFSGDTGKLVLEAIKNAAALAAVTHPRHGQTATTLSKAAELTHATILNLCPNLAKRFADAKEGMLLPANGKWDKKAVPDLLAFTLPADGSWTDVALPMTLPGKHGKVTFVLAVRQWPQPSLPLDIKAADWPLAVAEDGTATLTVTFVKGDRHDEYKPYFLRVDNGRLVFPDSGRTLGLRKDGRVEILQARKTSLKLAGLEAGQPLTLTAFGTKGRGLAEMGKLVRDVCQRPTPEKKKE